MKRIIEYKTLVDYTFMMPEDLKDYNKNLAEAMQRLEKQIEQAINEGYQPLGGIAITSKAPECALYLAQAVVKYEE